MNNLRFYTIGVFGSGEEEFFGKLKAHHIDTFCDIRQRRGVRGSKYAFVNSRQLQQTLGELGITYLHIGALAPTPGIRAWQKEADRQLGEQKTNRQALGKIFRIEYKKHILTPFDFEGFLTLLHDQGAKRTALFCVEEKPEACHRSLVSDHLKLHYGYEPTHL